MSKSSHLSDFALDRLCAGDAEPGAKAETEAHLASCERCQARRRTLEDIASQLLRDIPPLPFTERIAAQAAQKRALPLRALAVAASLVLALTGVLVLWSPWKPSQLSIRIKGSADIAFFVYRDGQGRPGKNGEALGKNDRIRFAVRAEGMPKVFVLSVADSGEITPYYPEGWEPSVDMPASDSPLLEGSIILDDYVGRERVFALFSQDPLEPQAVREVALRAWQDTRGAPGGVAALEKLPIDVLQASIWFSKKRQSWTK